MGVPMDEVPLIQRPGIGTCVYSAVFLQWMI
jgi:hypothetical protein